MPRNEDGEFELILGNRQLLSVFFIVVILLGVFFTMGYIVGRNSSPIVADAARKPAADAGVRPNPTGAVVVPPADTPSSAPTETAPAPVAAPVVEKDPTTAAEKADPPPEPKAKAAEKPKSASPLADQPAPGETYLQLTATQKAEAELFVDVLAKKGFHALYASVPDKPDMYRVLVGPLKDSSSVAQARTDLEKAGFQGVKALVRKY